MKAIQLKTKALTSFAIPATNWIIIRRRVATFIQKNSAVFEGLSRQSMPFGGNVLARR